MRSVSHRQRRARRYRTARLRPLTGEAVDDRVGGFERRRDSIIARLAEYDSGDGRALAADPANGAEGEAAAGGHVRAGLDTDEAVAPEQGVGVGHSADDRQRRTRRGDDAREHG